MNDITPRKRPLNTLSQPPRPRPPMKNVATPPAPTLLPQPLEDHKDLLTSGPLGSQSPKRSKKHTIWLSIIGLLLVLVAILAAAFLWYTSSLQPLAAQDKTRLRVEVSVGSSPGKIAKLLESKKVIQNALAFEIYTRLSRSDVQLRAGTYSLSPSESVATIVDHLASGNVDHFSITFLPGATLAENRAQLLKAGYGADAVDAALEKTYDHPLFKDKPAEADLEGYIYGETYNFDSNATVEQILTKTFDEYYAVIKKNDLIKGFEAQQLNLYQGITLASIIQREVPNAADQKQVAQIFFTRLRSGMTLGSDVTYQYAAKKLGITPSSDLDSPYNTRKYAGLPPGPVSTPGVTALQAVASPASGEYAFFLSGDDNITYFAMTNEEHEANVRDHCKVKCLLP